MGVVALDRRIAVTRHRSSEPVYRVRGGFDPLVVVGLSFLFGVLLFVSHFWSPVLYLLGILHIGILGVLWFLGGRQFPVFGAVTGILSIGLGAIALYLFFDEGMDSND